MTEHLGDLEKNIKLLLEKINRLRGGLILAVDEGVKFKLNHDLAAAERMYDQLLKERGKMLDFHTDMGASLLREKIKTLKINALFGEEQLVNCNRSKPKKRFWAAYDERSSQHFQYYFISACPTQMPPSFSEALIYELIREELDEEKGALYCHRHESNNRIRFYSLPIGHNLKKCQQQFQKFLARYFEWNIDFTLEDFLNSSLPKIPYDQVTICFSLSQSHWNDCFPDYFQWIMDTFSSIPENTPRFLFFFVLSLEGIHKEQRVEQFEILSCLNQLSQKNRWATHLSPLYPVPIQDLKDWFREELEDYNDGRQMAVIETLTEGLKGEDRRQYQEEKTLNMDDIERLQELILEVVQEQNRFFD